MERFACDSCKNFPGKQQLSWTYPFDEHHFQRLLRSWSERIAGLRRQSRLTIGLWMRMASTRLAHWRMIFSGDASLRMLRWWRCDGEQFELDWDSLVAGEGAESWSDESMNGTRWWTTDNLSMHHKAPSVAEQFHRWQFCTPRRTLFL